MAQSRDPLWASGPEELRSVQEIAVEMVEHELPVSVDRILAH